MENRKNCCERSALSSFSACDTQSEVSSTDTVEVIAHSDIILPTDQLFILRQHHDRTDLYQASLAEFSPEASLLLLQKAVQAMPRTDPADGMSLWLNNGAICLASGDANQLGTLSPPAMKQSLQAVMDTLPTHDPGDGSPWLNGGVLMRGTLKTP